MYIIYYLLWGKRLLISGLSSVMRHNVQREHLRRFNRSRMPFPYIPLTRILRGTIYPTVMFKQSFLTSTTSLAIQINQQSLYCKDSSQNNNLLVDWLFRQWCMWTRRARKGAWWGNVPMFCGCLKAFIVEKCPKTKERVSIFPDAYCICHTHTASSSASCSEWIMLRRIY